MQAVMWMWVSCGLLAAHPFDPQSASPKGLREFLLFLVYLPGIF